MDEKGKEDTVTKKITFPMSVWVQFENFAKQNYGDCYWLAIKDSMSKSKMIDSIDFLRSEISILGEEIEEIKSTYQLKDELPANVTLGDRGI